MNGARSRIFSFAITALAVFFLAGCAVIFHPHKDYGMSSDTRLHEARQYFDKALRRIDQADELWYQKPGHAAVWLEEAQGYLESSKFLYREEGQKYDIDVLHEVTMCESLYTETKLKLNKVQAKIGGR